MRRKNNITGSLLQKRLPEIQLMARLGLLLSLSDYLHERLESFMFCSSKLRDNYHNCSLIILL